MNAIMVGQLCRSLERVDWELPENVQKLESQVIEFRRETNRVGFHDQIIPIEFFLKALDELASDSRQFSRDEKKALARVVSLVAEQIFFISGYQNERIYKKTYDGCVDTLNEVASTLRTRDVATRFYVKYAKAAILSLEYGKGTVRETGTGHIKPFLKGILKLSPSAVAEPLVDFGQDMTKQFRDGKYVEVFPIRYFFSKAKDEESLKDNKIQGQVEGWVNSKSKGKRQALAVAEGVVNLAFATRDEKLREKLIFDGVGKIPSLCTLAKDPRWKVRFFVLDYLLNLDLEKFRISTDRSLPNFLAGRMSAETSNREISWLFHQVYKKHLRAGENPLAVDSGTMKKRRLELEQKSKKNSEKYTELKTDAQRIEQKLKNLEGAVGSIPQSASGAIGLTRDEQRQQDSTQPFDPLKCLTSEERTKYENWLSLQDELDGDMEELDLLLEIERIEEEKAAT